MAPTLRLQHLTRDLAWRVTDFLFPPLCLLCDTPRSPADRWLCEQCNTELRDNNARRDPCPICAMNRAKGPCACVHGWYQPFKRVVALFDFDPLMQECMHQVKYRGRKQFARHFGRRLFDLLPPAFIDEFDVLAPIPLHKSRERKRGYNQSFCFCLGIADRHPAIPVLPDALIRTKKTSTQTTLDREARQRNMAGAFVINPLRAERIAKKRLLLLDDVVTTGATTGAAARALLAGGCTSVTVLAVARD